MSVDTQTESPQPHPDGRRGISLFEVLIIAGVLAVVAWAGVGAYQEHRARAAQQTARTSPPEVDTSSSPAERAEQLFAQGEFVVGAIDYSARVAEVVAPCLQATRRVSSCSNTNELLKRGYLRASAAGGVGAYSVARTKSRDFTVASKFAVRLDGRRRVVRVVHPVARWYDFDGTDASCSVKDLGPCYKVWPSAFNEPFEENVGMVVAAPRNELPPFDYAGYTRAARGHR